MASGKRYELYEEYKIDNIWKSRKDILEYKIEALKLENNTYNYVLSGLLTSANVLKPSGKKLVGEDSIILFKNKDYNIVKYFYLKLILQNCINNENISDFDDFKKIYDIFKIIKI